jgi:spermidine synthase
LVHRRRQPEGGAPRTASLGELKPLSTSSRVSGQVGFEPRTLAARKEPAPIDVDALQRRLDRPDHARVKGSLAEVGLGSAVELLSTYAGRARDLAGWLKDAPINTDINLRLQYLAGLGLNFYQQDAILTELLTHRRPLDDLFVGTERTKRALREAMERRSKPPEQ